MRLPKRVALSRCKRGGPRIARSAPCYVLKTDELAALNYLQRGHPRPRALTWINRGTDQALRPTTVSMLLRTLFRPDGSPSVRKLHESAGLRISFSGEADRELFVQLFAKAREAYVRAQRSDLTAVFGRPEAAEAGYRKLLAAGVNEKAISILWRAGQFIRSMHDYPSGHSKRSIVAASAGGGLAGAIIGVTLLTIPGLGLVAAGGAIAAQALGTMGAVGGAIGASGGALARMLTDIDVDDREVPFYEMAIREGHVFISVDPASSGASTELVRNILEQCGGRLAQNHGAAGRQS